MVGGELSGVVAAESRSYVREEEETLALENALCFAQLDALEARPSGVIN
jgi:hypothetical protein